jgi:hypothetical protein
VNRAGVPVRAGSGSAQHVLYCGRCLGVTVIPGSDGQCGPTNGPQCPDCRGMTVGGITTVATAVPVQVRSSMEISVFLVKMSGEPCSLGNVGSEQSWNSGESRSRVNEPLPILWSEVRARRNSWFGRSVWP